MQRIALNRQISLLSISGQKRPPNFANVVQWLGDYYEGTDGCYYLKDKSTTRTDAQLVDSSVLELNQGSTEDNILNSNVLYTGGSFSASGIIKTDTLSQNPGFIFSDRTGTSFAFQLVLYLDGSFEWIIKTDSGTVSTIVVPSVVIGQYLSYKASIDVVAKSFSLEIENIVTGEIVSDTSSYTGDLVVDGNNIVLGWYFSGVGSRAFKGEFLNFKFGNKIDYVFGEATGDTVHNKIDGQPHGTITGTEPYFGTSDLQRPNNLIDGFDLWEYTTIPGRFLRVPFDNDKNSIKTDGDTISGYTWISRNLGIKNGLNRSETGIKQPEENELQTIASTYFEYNLLYGVQLLQNYNFLYSEGWLIISGWIIENEYLYCEGDGNIRFIEQDFNAEIGTFYDIQYEVLENTLNDGEFGLSSLGIFGSQNLDSSIGIHKYTFEAVNTGSTADLRMFLGALNTSGYIKIDYISIKQNGDTTGNPVFYRDISYNYELKNIWFHDVISKENRKFNWLVYNEPQAGQTLINILKYENSVERLQASDGYINAVDGRLYVLKEGVQ